jgi:outer membrane lipoprotein carrier protein
MFQIKLCAPLLRLFAGLAFAAGVCLSQQAHAATAQEQLQHFVEQVKAASGAFTQSVVTAQGQARPPQRGQFSFQRPGRFKWEVTQPYAQLIVSNSKEVFQLDPDLNQVTVRPVTKAIGSSPAAILFGSGSLEQNFKVTALPDKDGMAWLRALPRDSEAGFVHIDIGMRDNLPAQVWLFDGFGQTTRVELSGVVPNPALPASTFVFTAPAGVDVVRMQ